MQAMMERNDAKAAKCMPAVDTLGNLLTLLVTPANEQDCAQVGELAQSVQEVTGQAVEIAFVDQGYTGDVPAQEAKEHGIQLEVIKLPQAKRCFVLLPQRWVVERSFAWTTRFRRLVRDYERLPTTLVGFHLIVFASLMLDQWLAISSP
jgi:transposase